MSKVRIYGDVSGYVDIAVPDNAGTTTLNLDKIPQADINGNIAMDTNTLYVDAANNRVGVGTASPNTTLDIVSPSGAEAINIRGRSADDIGQLKFYENDGTTSLARLDSRTTHFEVGSYNELRFSAGGVGNSHVVIDTSGRVGIGATTPNYDLQISRTATSVSDDPTFEVKNTWSGQGNNVGYRNKAIGLFSSGNGTVITRVQSRYDTGANVGSIGTQTSHDFLLTTGDTERMRINSSGVVTIGDPNASSYGGGLTVATASGSYITVADTGSGERLHLEGGSGLARIGTMSNHDLQIITNGYSNEVARFDTNGNFLVGGTNLNPIGNHVSQVIANGTNGLGVHRDGGTPFKAGTDDNRNIIEAYKQGVLVGGLGIQSGGFTIDGEANHTGLMFASASVLPRDNSAGTNGTVDLGTNDGRWKDFYLSGGVQWTEGQVEINSGRLLQRSTGDASGLRFDGSGYTPFKNGSAADGTVDLGYSGGRYKNLYLSGGVYLGGLVGANKLDDYEEGTFTLNLHLPPDSLTNSHSTQNNRYIKIGSQVWIQGKIWLSGSSNSGSTLRCSGLPFTTVSGTASTGSMISRYGASFDFVPYVYSNSSEVHFYQISTTGSWNQVQYSELAGTFECHFNITYHAA